MCFRAKTYMSPPTKIFQTLRPIVLWIVVMACLVADANAGEAANLIGKTRRVNRDEFGWAITDERVSTAMSRKSGTGSSGYLGLLVEMNGGLVFLVAEPNWNAARTGYDTALVKDAIDIPKGLDFAGWPIERPCISPQHPTELIIAVGKWVDRDSKKGGYAGAYLAGTVKAWRFDFDAAKLRQIPTAGIRCEDNRNEDDF